MGYQGKASFYAFCPECKSRIRINAEESSKLSLDKWAVEAPIEVNLPQNRKEAMANAQKYAQEMFKESSIMYAPIVLTRTLRVRHSNYRKLLGEIDRKAKEQRASTEDIFGACKIIKDRIDSRISDLMLTTKCEREGDCIAPFNRGNASLSGTRLKIIS
ncbi:MAG: hypothetical protein ABR985_13615 [Methanotrichaceae archaeon]